MVYSVPKSVAAGALSWTSLNSLLHPKSSLLDLGKRAPEKKQMGKDKERGEEEGRETAGWGLGKLAPMVQGG